MDIGFFNYYNSESNSTPLTAQEPYREVVERYEADQKALKNKKNNSYSNKRLAIREFDEHLAPMAESVRAKCKTNQDVRRFLHKKYFGSEEVNYTKKWEDPTTYAMLENDYNAICFGNIEHPNTNDPRLKFEDEDWEEYKKENQDEDKKIFNSKMETMIENADIKLSVSDSFVISFNPYTYEADIKSDFDNLTNEKLKSALNSADNSKELFYFTYQNSNSLNSEGISKMKAYHSVLDYTGLKLNELTQKEEGFFTPKGENILDVIKEKIETSPTIDKNETDDTFSHLKDVIDDVSHVNYKNLADLSLSIIYSPKDGFIQTGATYSA